MIVGCCCCRCDLVQLVSETLMARQGYGSDEKHCPSRVSLQLTPMAQPDILSVSVTPASIGSGVSTHEAVHLRP